MSTYDNSNINNGLALNHPRVVSYISNNEQTAEASEGGLRTFAVVISEKGVDNVSKLVTNTNELIQKYGNLNNKLYGQTMYNVQNWLDGNGEAYILRVMPDDAGYAHAFMNIQTIRSNKTVKDVDGNKLTIFPNISLRTVISASEVNNINESLLQYELEKDRTNNPTIDGYQNHLIMSVYPEGRGKFYNNMGFRLTLNNQFDDTYDFRVYNFEVVDFGKNDIVEIKEGPFFVSFDPDALSSSNDQSMFIEDVVNKYSKYLRVKVNTAEFVKLCKIINNEIDNVYSIDPIFGVTRKLQGDPQTYLNSLTNKLEDVHIAIQSYDVEGDPIIDEQTNQPVVNIADTSSALEQDIVNNDNLYNRNKYQTVVNSEESMQAVLVAAKAGTAGGLKNLIKDLIKIEESDGDGSLNSKLSELVTKVNDLDTKLTTFNTNENPTENDYKTIEDAINSCFETEDSMTIDARKVLDHCKAVRDRVDVNLSEAISNLEIINDILNSKDATKLRYLSENERLVALSASIGLLTEGNYTDKAEFIPQALTVLRNNIQFIHNTFSNASASGVSSLTIAGTFNVSDGAILLSADAADIAEIDASYNKIVDVYSELLDEFNTQVMKDQYMQELWTELVSLIGNCRNQSRSVLIALNAKIVKSLHNGDITGGANLTTLVSSLNQIALKASTTFDTNVSNQELLKNLIKGNIKNNRTESETAKSLLCISALQSLMSPIKLAEGNDGALDVSNPDRANVIKQLLIKAYSGLVDENILNKKLMPFSFIIDGNNSVEVKNAIVQLCTNIRKDFVFIADCGLQADAESTLNFRKNSFPVSDNLVAIYGQDFTVYDSFNGKDERFTTPFFVAKKITSQANTIGLQYPMAGNSRGTIDGFKSINFIPNDTYKEMLYNNRINYVESDEKRTKLMSQLTSGYSRTPLSDLNNVISMLAIRRDVENMVEDYQFEFEDDDTIRRMEYAINDSLNKYVTNRSCASIVATVSASEYDRERHQLKVNVILRFLDIIETVIITIDVQR